MIFILEGGVVLLQLRVSQEILLLQEKIKLRLLQMLWRSLPMLLFLKVRFQLGS